MCDCSTSYFAALQSSKTHGQHGTEKTWQRVHHQTTGQCFCCNEPSRPWRNRLVTRWTSRVTPKLSAKLQGPKLGDDDVCYSKEFVNTPGDKATSENTNLQDSASNACLDHTLVITSIKIYSLSGSHDVNPRRATLCLSGQGKVREIECRTPNWNYSTKASENEVCSWNHEFLAPVWILRQLWLLTVLELRSPLTLVANRTGDGYPVTWPGGAGPSTYSSPIRLYHCTGFRQTTCSESCHLKPVTPYISARVTLHRVIGIIQYLFSRAVSTHLKKCYGSGSLHVSRWASDPLRTSLRTWLLPGICLTPTNHDQNDRCFLPEVNCNTFDYEPSVASCHCSPSWSRSWRCEKRSCADAIQIYRA